MKLPPCDHDECPPTGCTHEKPNAASVRQMPDQREMQVVVPVSTGSDAVCWTDDELKAFAGAKCLDIFDNMTEADAMNSPWWIRRAWNVGKTIRLKHQNEGWAFPCCTPARRQAAATSNKQGLPSTRHRGKHYLLPLTCPIIRGIFGRAPNPATPAHLRSGLIRTPRR